MARVFIEGFEANQLNAWTTTTGAPAIGTASSYGMTGDYCVVITNDSIIRSFTAIGTIYVAIKMRYSIASAATRLIQFELDGTKLGSIGINSTTRKLEAYRGTYQATTIGTGTTVLTGDTNYFLEVKYIPHDSTGTFIVKLNGITEITIDGDGNTAPAGYTTIDTFRIGDAANCNGCYYDDIVLDDSNWIGQTYVQGCVPSGAGSNTNWSPSAGSNYACVDEIPHNSDTDYVYINSNDVVDTYAMGDLSGSINSIKCVQVHAMARREETSTPTKVGLTVKSGTTTDTKTGQSVPISADYSHFFNVWEVDPNTSSAWSESGVNAMEAGVKSLA